MTIFGAILTLPNQPSTVTFLAVFIFFLVFEGVLHTLEVECYKRGYRGLIKKLYREFMSMGLIAFLIDLISEGYSISHNPWIEAFKVAEIIVLFIGLTFLVQSLLLVSLVSSRNKTLLRHDNDTSEQLLIEYIDLRQLKNWKKFFFDYGPITIPIPQLREKIEYKIIQEFFIRVYNLPPEFKFANYMCAVLKDYMIALVEIRPISWLLMSFLVVLNFVRIQVIDPIYQSSICGQYAPSSTTRRQLTYAWIRNLSSASAAGDDEHAHRNYVCEEYTLRYAFICLILITLYLIIILFFSEVYMQRLLDKVLKQEEDLERLEEAEDEYAKRVMSRQTGIRFMPKNAEEKKVEQDESNEGKDHLRYDISDHDEDDDSPDDEDDAPANTSHPKSNVNLMRAAHLSVNQMRLTSSPSSVASPPPPELDEFIALEGHSKMANQAIARFGKANYKRKFLYIKCLQRITDLEFDIYKKEARRLSGSLENVNIESLYQTKDPPARLITRMASMEDIRNVFKSSTLPWHSTKTSTTTHLNGRMDEENPLPDLQVDDASHAIPNGLANILPSPTQECEARPRIRSIEEKQHTKEVNINRTRNLQRIKTMRLLRESHQNTSFHSNNAHKNTVVQGNSHESLNLNRKLSVGNKDTYTKALPFTDSTKINILRRTSDEQMHGQNKTRYARSYTEYYFERMPSLNDTGGVGTHHSDIHGGPLDEHSHDNWTFKMKMMVQTLFRSFVSIVKIFIKALFSHQSHPHTSNTHHHPHDANILLVNQQFESLFVWGQSELYYHSVEMGLLIQSVYIAFWATNLVTFAIYSEHVVLWLFAVTLPAILNGYIIKLIIFNSCMLRSILQLDSTIADRICEEALEERNVSQRLRKTLRDAMKAQNIPKDEYDNYLHEQFHELTSEGSERGLDLSKWKLLLHNLQIRLTDKSLARIFDLMDFDKDDILLWEDLHKVAFPDLQKKKYRINEEVEVSNERRKVILQYTKDDDKEGSPLSRLEREKINGTDISQDDPNKMEDTSSNDKDGGREDAIVNGIDEIRPMIPFLKISNQPVIPSSPLVNLIKKPLRNKPNHVQFVDDTTVSITETYPTEVIIDCDVDESSASSSKSTTYNKTKNQLEIAKLRDQLRKSQTMHTNI